MTEIPLREHLEAIMHSEGSRVEGLIKSGYDRIEERLQEIYRRLDAQNHIQERAEQLRNTYVTREMYDRRHTELEREVDLLRRTVLAREVFEKTLDEWNVWRTGVNAAVVRAAERKAVYASILISGLTFLGIIVTTVLRISGR